MLNIFVTLPLSPPYFRLSLSHTLTLLLHIWKETYTYGTLVSDNDDFWRRYSWINPTVAITKTTNDTTGKLEVAEIEHNLSEVWGSNYNDRIVLNRC